MADRWAIRAVALMASIFLGTILFFDAASADTITQARFNADEQMQSAGGAQVQLPDIWEKRGVTGHGRVSYDIAFDAPSGEPLWVFVRKVRRNARFLLNGEYVWSGGRMDPPITRHANLPFFFALPTGLTRPQGNILTIEVAADPGRRGGLSVVDIAPYDELKPLARWRRFVQYDMVLVTSSVAIATALYALMVWVQNPRREQSLVYLGIGGLIWGGRNLHLVTRDLPIQSLETSWLIEVLIYSSNGWFLGFTALFLLGQFGNTLKSDKVRNVLRALVILLIVLGPVIILVAGSHSPGLTIWIAIGLPVILSMAALVVRHAWATRRKSDIAFAALFILMIALFIYDNALLIQLKNFGRPYLAHFGALMFFMACAQLLVSRYGHAQRRITMMNADLEERLQQREQELAESYEAIRQAEVEKTRLHERSRIMRDLHDGVGSTLVFAIQQVRRSGSAPKGLESRLNECLSDLRMAIESHQSTDEYLSTILGTMRSRIQEELDQRSVKLIWDIEEVENVNLDASARLHLLRFLQEAVANALKHSHCNELRVGLSADERHVRIEVEDDGVGFDPKSPSAGNGLRNMKHRAEELGGTFELKTSEQGTRVSIVLEH